MAPHGQGVGGFGDLGVGDQRGAVRLAHRTSGSRHQDDRGVVDGLAGRGRPGSFGSGLDRVSGVLAQAGGDTFFVPNAESPRAMIVASGSIARAVVIAWVSCRAAPRPEPVLPLRSHASGRSPAPRLGWTAW